MRKAIAHAPVYLHISQSKEGSHTKYKIDQTTTASIPAVNEEWITDWTFRTSKDPVMGEVKAKARWAKPSDGEDADFLAGDWIDEGDDQVEAFVESAKDGWTAHQVWRSGLMFSVLLSLVCNRFGALKICKANEYSCVESL